VIFSDGSVGVFALPEYCFDDQTHAVLELLKRRGLRLNQPPLFVLPPALLLAIDKQADEQSAVLVGSHTDRQAQQGALSAAFDALLRWGVVRRASDIHFNVNRHCYSSPVFFTLNAFFLTLLCIIFVFIRKIHIQIFVIILFWFFCNHFYYNIWTINYIRGSYLI
jgi:hypothetical protein